MKGLKKTFDKPLAMFTKKRQNTSKIKNEKGEISTHTAEIQKNCTIQKNYTAQKNQINNNLCQLITRSETESVIKKNKPPYKEKSRPRWHHR